MGLNKVAGLFLVLSLVFSVHAKAGNGTETNGTSEISVMAYNVANFFDTKHDPGKDDETYLPLAAKQNPADIAKCNAMTVYPWREECLHLDWNENVLKVKMAHIANVIQTINNGRGPDVLLLEEVENLPLLQRLNSEYLQASNYTTVILIEGSDDRGIDQAILSRLPVLDALNYKIPITAVPGANSYKDPSKTRGLLTAVLQLPDGNRLTVFAVHFPSGDAHPYRAQALDFLTKMRALAVPADGMTLVGGDFNINSKEDAQYAMYGQVLGNWAISHKIGCAGCIGTEYYATEKSWSFLDAIGVSQNMLAAGSAPWYVDTASIQVPDYSAYQVLPDGRPNEFNPVAGTGVSDHFPVFEILRRR